MTLEDLKEKFVERFGFSPVAIGRAPGRLEILGNHTDYNEGFVLSCATDRNTWFVVAPCEDESEAYSIAFNSKVNFDVNNLEKAPHGDWGNYIRGVITELQKRGHTIQNFKAIVHSDIPLSAGMSSSASFEMAICYALGKLNDIDLPKEDWARIGQACENNYIGANTGLLDQFSSVAGETDKLVYTDFRTVEAKTIAMPEGYAFVIANSGVKHDLTLEYNERRESCEKAATQLGVPFLRDTNMQTLVDSKDKLDHLPYLRALHVVGENERVQEGLKALEGDDIVKFGKLLSASHQSSIDNFENSCKELDILVSAGQALEACIGARLSGGGFGGISIHLVREEDAEKYREDLDTAFKMETGTEPETMICKVGQGAEVYV
ncbi:MAG: galactokinase [Lentisphaeria bacterium]|nr:galactokinase [Lentisphaeria bacterium]